MSLRDYQATLKAACYQAWNGGARVVMPTMATGGGKTVLFSDITRDFNCPTCIIAHRDQLVSQAALTLNREKIPHRIIASKQTIRAIVALEQLTHGEVYYSPRAQVGVAGVHTLALRDPGSDWWFQTVRLVISDEGHHVLRDSVWSKAIDLFPGALVLLPTAHARRADGRGLGRSADGIVDSLVVGPCGRDLISRGFLSDYQIAVPPNDLDLSDVPVGPSGDLNAAKLRIATHRSKTIVGNVAKHYVKFAGGKLGLTFAVDIEAAKEITNAYRALGVPADIITADTPIDIRAKLMAKFRARQLLQLVSVDVLGEGTDVPAVEVVSMARATASWQLYCQQFGRGLRVNVADHLAARWDQFTDQERLAHIAASDKPRAIVIDHVGNFERHYKDFGAPCSRQEYTLERVEKRSRKAKPDAIPLRYCVNDTCFQPYERTLSACPYCGTPAPPPGRRGSPEAVEGDLVLLDPEAMRELTAERAKVDGPYVDNAEIPALWNAGNKKKHLERQRAQASLRDAMMLVGGYFETTSTDTRVNQKRFFYTFGVDVMTATTLNPKDAEQLEAKIRAYLLENRVVPA
jgi:DNA repair protein RadD